MQQKINSVATRKCTNERVIDANCACSLGAAAAIRLIAAITGASICIVSCLSGRLCCALREMPLLSSCCVCARTESNNGPKKSQARGLRRIIIDKSRVTIRIKVKPVFAIISCLARRYLLGPAGRQARGRPAPENHSPPLASCPKTYNWHIPQPHRRRPPYALCLCVCVCVCAPPSQSHISWCAARTIFLPPPRNHFDMPFGFN